MSESLGDLKKRFKNESDNIIGDKKVSLKYIPNNYAFIYRGKIHIKLESNKYNADNVVLDVLEESVYLILETAKVYPVKLKMT